MKIGIASPIPVLGSLPGPSRPGWPSGGAFEFKMEIQGPETFSFNASKTGGGTNFSIDWGDTTTASGLTGTSHSHTYGAGTFTLVINSKDDAGPIDTFQVTGVQANKNSLKKILSWGEIPWKNLNDAFKNCYGLTKINGGKLIGGVNCNLVRAFQGCTGLTEAICKNWDLSLGCSMYQLFETCDNLELLNLTGSKFANTGSSNFAFHAVGTNVSSGCDFKMSNLDFTGTTNNTAGMQWFKSSKFKDGSNLSNWTFPSTLDSVRGTEMFDSSIINGTLDLSNWTWPNQEFPSFTSINSALTSQNGSKIKLSNWDVSVVSNFANKFNSCKVYELEGLSTWGACAGNASTFRMFSGAVLMRINPSDNFSNAFMASLTPIYVNEMFRNFSRDLLDAERGPCPNLSGLNLSNLTAPTVNGLISFMNNSHFTNTPDFSNVTFSSNNTVNFSNAFRQFDTIGTGSDSIFNFNPTTVKPANFTSAFYFAHGLSEVNIGSNVDMSSAVDFNDMFRLINNSTAASTFTNVTFPTNADFSSLTSLSRTFEDFSGNPIMSVCQTDNFIRRLKATNNNTNLTVNFYANKVTEAPSVVRSDVDYLENTKGWNITLATPDVTLPFAYANYAVDPTGITTISPITTPPAGSVFTATNSLSINSSTGVITIGSFRGGSTIRCTYPDGCYNEVVMLIQVPFKMNITIPAGSTSFELKPQMSAGECFVDWGDSNSQTLTANTTHSYASSGSDQTYPVKIFDSPSGSKFTGFNSSWSATSGGYIDDIAQWGEIEWQNNKWFINTSKSTITATDTPNLSQVTSLQQMFSSNGINSTFSGGSAISNWDVSTITNMSSMFWKVGSANFTQNLSNWDVSNVTTLQRFNYTYPEYLSYNQNWVADWGNKTSNVEDFSYFMYGGKNNSIAVNSNMGNYNTSSATNMTYMFFNNGGDIANCKTKIVNAGQADEYIAWDVKKVENFSYMFAGGSGRFVSTEFPDNWYISGDSQDINMQNMFGWFYGSGSLNNITDLNSFATKTISAVTSPYGTQYTAWNMSNTTNLSGFAQGNNANQLNWNINTWQISNKLTRLDSMLGIRKNSASWTYALDQDLGHWDISNVTNATNSWFNRYPTNPIPAGYSVNFSTANYDSLLSITDGWGQHASSAQSGVTLNMGTSKYTAGGAAEQGRTALVNAGWTITDGGAIYSNTNALSFNGSTEYIDTEITPRALVGNSNAYSVSAYVYIEEEDIEEGNYMIIGGMASDGTGGRWYFRVLDGNASFAYGSSASGNNTYSGTATPVTAGQWNHLAFTFNGTNTHKIYVNGGAAKYSTTSGSGQTITNFETAYIGALNYNNIAQNHFKGKIDEVMVWNTELTQGEVQAYANVVGSGSIPDPNAITGLQLWNRMGD